MDSNESMVDYLVEMEKIQSPEVEQAFRNVDRKRFMPDDFRDRAYEDRPFSLAENSTISAPHMVAIDTELLEVKEDSSVVEVGSGSGYQLAILSELGKEVKGIELNEELFKSSKEKLSDRENVDVFHGSGLEPLKENFDRILFSCAVESIEPFLEKLKEDGVMVAPVNEELGTRLKKWKNGTVSNHGFVRFTDFR
ncbi:MAG: methyltransferase domain-containing protein [Nanohaloarchaea archaeon]|nr:methyltransferase domain-containing protein [Candidatus Nanohaloarchaea archaeon]